MEKFLKKNLKWIALLFLFLFCIKSFQSCLRGTELTRLEKNLTYNCDSLINDKNIIIDSLETEVITKDYIIYDLTNELKIAGVKVNEAQKRADAVQKTAEDGFRAAEKIKTNQTIEITTPKIQKDTTNKE